MLFASHNEDATDQGSCRPACGPVHLPEPTSMSTARRILIVDDDEELRESLKDQLALHDEFEVLTAGTASKGMELGKNDHFDLVVLDVSLARHGWPRGRAAPAQGRLQDPDRHADGQCLRRRPDPRSRRRRQRLRHQAVQVRGAARPHTRAAAPARAERGCGLCDRALHVQAGLQASARREGHEDPA